MQPTAARHHARQICYPDLVVGLYRISVQNFAPLYFRQLGLERQDVVRVLGRVAVAGELRQLLDMRPILGSHTFQLVVILQVIVAVRKA